MSAKYPRCQECGKLSIPVEEWRRLKEGDKEKVCKCKLMSIEPAKSPVDDDEDDDVPVVSAAKCQTCGKTILPARSLEAIADPKMRAKFCQGHKKRAMDDLEVIEENDEPVYRPAKTKRRSPLAEMLGEPFVFAMGAVGLIIFLYGALIFGVGFLSTVADFMKKDLPDGAERSSVIGFITAAHFSFGAMGAGSVVFLLAKISRALHLGLLK